MLSNIGPTIFFAPEMLKMGFGSLFAVCIECPGEFVTDYDFSFQVFKPNPCMLTFKPLLWVMTAPYLLTLREILSPTVTVTCVARLMGAV